MKRNRAYKPFLKAFIAMFLALFVVLNFRFVYANIKFWLAGTDTPDIPLLTGTDNGAAYLFPLSEQRGTSIDDVPLGDAATLEIPNIGVRAPIVFETSVDPDIIYQRLEDGVLHYANSPKPGQRGTALILGHSSAYPWYKGRYGSVFALLGKLTVGDTITVQYEDGKSLTFAVTESLVFNPFTDAERFEALSNAGQTPAIILVSCWPVGTNYRRIAIKATLID